MINLNDLLLSIGKPIPSWDKEEFSDDSLGMSFEGIDDPEFNEIKDILKGYGNFTIDPRVAVRLNEEKEALKYFKEKGVFNPRHFLWTVFGVKNTNFRTVFFAIAYHKELMDKICLNYTLQGKLAVKQIKTKKTEI